MLFDLNIRLWWTNCAVWSLTLFFKLLPSIHQSINYWLFLFLLIPLSLLFNSFHSAKQIALLFLPSLFSLSLYRATAIFIWRLFLAFGTVSVIVWANLVVSYTWISSIWAFAVFVYWCALVNEFGWCGWDIGRCVSGVVVRVLNCNETPSEKHKWCYTTAYIDSLV